MKCKYATISRIVLYMTYDETITLRHLLFTTNELQCWQVSFATGSAKRAKISRNDEEIQNCTSQLKPNASAAASKKQTRHLKIES